ncbi:MAG TPA: hypothetical protein VEH31_10695 [Streptosporangiaceae bacterium]|nr:hypothetical protein [Streptosporangiaceae bacterium]
MAKQVQVSPELRVAALEERVHALEARLTAVTAAVRVLAHGLEDVPLAVPGGRPAAAAARQAYELLLIAEPLTPDPEAVAASPDG